eukprot:TRINITY_DN8996_c0_g1_i5.p1 TRINITY_DN8996_c0_g1~~TRINITY_DN8996_c0_g1_i5.p1  ORF type:complete len:349 (+),score=34.66 TRINITY_DN8996_c0_g1_i5:238-1284(+)
MLDRHASACARQDSSDSLTEVNSTAPKFTRTISSQTLYLPDGVQFGQWLAVRSSDVRNRIAYELHSIDGGNELGVFKRHRDTNESQPKCSFWKLASTDFLDPQGSLNRYVYREMIDVPDSAWRPLRTPWNMLRVHSSQAYIEFRPVTPEELENRIAAELQCASGKLASNRQAWRSWEAMFFPARRLLDFRSGHDWHEPAAHWEPLDTAADTCRFRWRYLEPMMVLDWLNPTINEASALEWDLRIEARHMFWEVQLVRQRYSTSDDADFSSLSAYRPRSAAGLAPSIRLLVAGVGWTSKQIVGHVNKREQWSEFDDIAFVPGFELPLIDTYWWEHIVYTNDDSLRSVFA